MCSEIHTLFEVIYRPYMHMNTHIQIYLYIHIFIDTYIWRMVCFIYMGYGVFPWHEGMMVNLCSLLLLSFNKLQSVFWKLQIFFVLDMINILYLYLYILNINIYSLSKDVFENDTNMKKRLWKYHATLWNTLIFPSPSERTIRKIKG